MEIRSMPTASIAVMSANAELAGTIAELLSDMSTEVTHRPRMHGGMEEGWSAQRPDIVVMDGAALPDVGRQIRHLRHRWPTLEIVVLNARNDVEVEVFLDAGADDAVVVGSRQLTARLHACARRARTVNAGTRIAIGDVVFDRESRRVWCAGREVDMTPRECAVLDCLFWHAPDPVSVSMLADFVWGDSDGASRRNAVLVYIGYVRKKLSGSRAVAIRNVRHVGYQFDALG
jgi:two-component system OmpR family response regulator